MQVESELASVILENARTWLAVEETRKNTLVTLVYYWPDVARDRILLSLEEDASYNYARFSPIQEERRQGQQKAEAASERAGQIKQKYLDPKSDPIIQEVWELLGNDHGLEVTRRILRIIDSEP